MYIGEGFNFVKEYFSLFDLAFCARILPILCYALLKQIMRYNSCSREFSVLATKDFRAKETAVSKTDKRWVKENITVTGLELGSEL